MSSSSRRQKSRYPSKRTRRYKSKAAAVAQPQAPSADTVDDTVDSDTDVLPNDQPMDGTIPANADHVDNTTDDFNIFINSSILMKIHAHLFQDIYEWAGKYRTVDISKGQTRFCKVNFIESSIKSVLSSLAENHFLQDLDKKDFSVKSAYYMGEINAIHPFREGNGRSQREFLNQLALNKGAYIHWHKCDTEEILEATIKSFNQDYDLLEKIIHENLFEI